VRISPKVFFKAFVLPTVEEFRREPLSERRAFLAAIVVNHLADYAAAHENVELIDLVRRLGNPPVLHVVRDVADAAKHSVLRKDDRTVKDSGQIERLHSPGIFQAPLGQGVFAEANAVCVHRIGHPPTQLLPALDAAVDIWTAYLQEA
jgi:hypothetical protein